MVIYNVDAVLEISFFLIILLLEVACFVILFAAICACVVKCTWVLR